MKGFLNICGMVCINVAVSSGLVGPASALSNAQSIV
jgi:hypothetical protein